MQHRRSALSVYLLLLLPATSWSDSSSNPPGEEPTGFFPVSAPTPGSAPYPAAPSPADDPPNYVIPESAPTAHSGPYPDAPLPPEASPTTYGIPESAPTPGFGSYRVASTPPLELASPPISHGIRTPGFGPFHPSPHHSPPSSYIVPERGPSSGPDYYPFTDSSFRDKPPKPFFPFDDPSLLFLPPPFAKISVLHKHLYTIIEPAVVAITGILVFLFVKNVVIPHLTHVYRSLDDDGFDEEEERSLAMNALTVRVLRALAKGACLQEMACRAGLRARDYNLTDAIVRAIDDTKGPPHVLAAIFRDATTGRVSSCEPYVCKKNS